MASNNMSENDEGIVGIKIEDVLSVDSSGDEEPITMLNTMNESRAFIMKKNWGKGETGEFIANLQQHGALWDTSNPAYNRSSRERSYEEMAKTFNCSVLDIKKKIKTIRTQLIREWRRINKPEELSKTDSLRNSDWEHWPSLQFMLQTITPMRMKSSAPSQSQNNYEPDYKQSVSTPAPTYSHEQAHNSSYHSSSTVVSAPPHQAPYPVTTQLHNQHMSLKRKLSRTSIEGSSAGIKSTDNVVAVKTCNALTSCMGMLERSITTKTSEDKVSHFCRNLDDKMKRMEYYTRVVVEKKINDVVFDAEMSLLSQQRESYSMAKDFDNTAAVTVAGSSSRSYDETVIVSTAESVNRAGHGYE